MHDECGRDEGRRAKGKSAKVGGGEWSLKECFQKRFKNRIGMLLQKVKSQLLTKTCLKEGASTYVMASNINTCFVREGESKSKLLRTV